MSFPIHVRIVTDDGAVIGEDFALFEEPATGYAVNRDPISLPALLTGTAKFIELRRRPSIPAVVRVKMTLPTFTQVGDTLNFNAKAITVEAPGGCIEGMFSDVRCSERDAYLAENPNASPEQIWDEAFVSGHTSALTLVGG